MNILIYGAGAIGVTYAWLLSGKHNVSVLVKPEREESARAGFSLAVKDLREKPAKEIETLYRPRIVTGIEDRYDVILVAVNRYQLAGVLPHLERVDADIILMLNHWEIKQELDEHLRPGQYLIGFPSQVGGGREGTAIRVNVYDEGTVLGEADGTNSERLNHYRREFEQARLKVEVKDNILDWMKVHYLQQSISAGAVLKAGSYEAFAGNYRAVLKWSMRSVMESRSARPAASEQRSCFPPTCSDTLPRWLRF